MKDDMIEYAESYMHDEAYEEPEANTASITVTGPGISITRTVDEVTMSSVIALLFGGRTLVTTARGAGGASDGSGAGTVRDAGAARQQAPSWGDDDLTLGEFIDETGAKTFQHKICATGYYLMHLQGAQSFSRDDVKSALSDAHEDMPGNFTRDFSETAAKSLIARKSGEADRYIIPRTGRIAVESHFQELPKRRAPRRTARKASPSGGTAE